MFVRKINEEWKPAENRNLKVGQVIDITDPRLLIKMGIVEEVKAEVKVEPMEREMKGIEGSITFAIEGEPVCPKCGRTFKLVSNLKTHERFCKA